MSLKSKKFKVFWIVMLTSIVTAVFIYNGFSVQEQSPNSKVTIKLKVLSESIKFDDISEIRKLIEAGANVNVINKYGATPLYVASSAGHTEVVKLLLEAGADVNKGMTDIFTPLFIASSNGHTGIVKLLKKYDTKE